MSDHILTDSLSARSTGNGDIGRWPSRWVILSILALTFAVYAPTLRYQFVHDDRGQIVENPAVHTWSAVPRYFTEHIWAAVMPGVYGNYYRPVFLLWLRMNDALFGAHAWAWHLSTILVHMVATLLLYLLVLNLVAEPSVAALAALIFGLHPAHIEGVAWISGVTEPLLGVFFIGSILAYLQWREAQQAAAKWKVASLLLFALGILEKETGVILPILLWIYEWIYSEDGKPSQTIKNLAAWTKRTLTRTWAYFAILTLYVPARIYALKGFNHVVTRLTTGELISTWPALILFWFRHLVWPASLSTYYNFPALHSPTLRGFVFPAVLDVAIGVVIYAAVRRSKSGQFFAAWLVLPLIPLLNLRVFIANDFAHDRYLYLPSAGFSVLMAMLLVKVLSISSKRAMPTAKLLIVAGVLAAMMMFGVVTESFYFRDNITFYAYNLTRSPHNPDAESNYGSVLAENGQFGAAISALTDAVTYNPTAFTPLFNLALTYYKTGNLPEAEKHFRHAIELNPTNPDDYFYLGLVEFKTNRTAEAISTLRQAIAIRPGGHLYHFALGIMLKSSGDLRGAAEEFRSELAGYPNEKTAAQQLGEVESQLKQ